MRAYRILGVLWMINFCLGAVGVVRAFMRPVSDVVPPLLSYSVLACIAVIHLIGIFAGIFLMRRAKWAQWFLGFYSIVVILACIVNVITHRYVTLWIGAHTILAFVSAVLLLKPRAYAAT